MAKLRFPGRPGQKHEKTAVTYRSQAAKHGSNYLPTFVAHIQQGLQLFSELVGLSDEEEEFEGFSSKDVKDAERKYKKKQLEYESSDEDITSPGTRLSEARRSLENLPTSDRTRNRAKTVVRQSYSELVQKGAATQKKSAYVSKLVDIVSPQNVKEKHEKKRIDKPKKFKLDFIHKTGGASDKIKSRIKSRIKGDKRIKRTDANLAKQLLLKAKHGRSQTQLPLTTTERRFSYPKKQFVLPTQSSRSSRVIKPNKRFIEDDTLTEVKKKQLKTEVKVELSPAGKGKTVGCGVKDSSSGGDVSRRVFKDSPRGRGSVGTLYGELDYSSSGKVTPHGLLEQPLITDGKRHRKPSKKMLSLEAESLVSSPDTEDWEISPRKSGEKKSLGTSPFSAPPSFGGELFSAHCPTTEFHKATEKQRKGMMDFTAGRKHGTSILRKAKLQLNRAALNKSKAALARSLKAQMKREAREERHLSGSGVVSPVPGNSHLSSNSSKADQGFGSPTRLPQKSDDKCLVCSDNSKVGVHHGVTLCEQCMKFYNYQRKQALTRTYACSYTGSCKITPSQKKVCVACRFLKCLQNIPWNKADLALNSFRSPTGKRILPSKKTSESCITEFSPINLTLSGERREKLRKKRRAFKELLKAKQERVDSPDIEELESGDTSAQEFELEPSQEDDVPSPSTATLHGPRIKHVCRNASVVLGQLVATFPPQSEIRLSALPIKEKKQILKDDKAVRADLSDDERPLEEIIQQSDDSITVIRKSPPKTVRPHKRPFIPLGKRKIRCKTCAGCTAADCGKCRYCLDKPKFGGRSVMKQACMHRKCVNPLYSKAATNTFLQLKHKGGGGGGGMRAVTVAMETDSDSVVSNTESTHSSPYKDVRSVDTAGDSMAGGAENLEAAVGGAESLKGAVGGAERLQAAVVGQLSVSVGTGGSKAVSRSVATGSEVRRLEFGGNLSSVTSSSHRLPGKIHDNRLKTSAAAGLVKLKNKDKVLGRAETVTLQSVIPASNYMQSTLQNTFPVKVDFKEQYTVGLAWKYGVALTVSGSLCVRALCYLCGSAGKQDLIYCTLCCEPFHEFCLDDEEEWLSSDHKQNWCCQNCRFCHVCGRQNNLLQCDKCRDTYHPECLGPNYPTKPTKKGVWICTKCVKCKSCGATTPGSAYNATWTYDFSLCFECGQLMDKGNFCPVCRKCYTDDDWESKMIQCSTCDSWVHARCEGLSDEMYDMLSFMPEDLTFNCQKCFPNGQREWLIILRKEMLSGLKNVLTSLLSTRSSQLLLVSTMVKKPSVEGEAKASNRGLACDTNVTIKETDEISSQTSTQTPVGHSAVAMETDSSKEQDFCSVSVSEDFVKHTKDVKCLGTDINDREDRHVEHTKSTLAVTTVSAVPTQTMSAVTMPTMSAVTTQTMSAVTTPTMSAVTTTMSAVTTPTMSAVTTPTVSAVTTHTTSAVTTPTMSAVTTPTVSAVTTPTVSAVTTPTVSAVTTPTMSAVTTPTVSAVTTPTVSAVTTPTVSAVTTPTVSAVTTQTMSAVTTPTVSAVTTPTMSAVTTPTVSAVTTPHFSMLSNSGDGVCSSCSDVCCCSISAGGAAVGHHGYSHMETSSCVTGPEATNMLVIHRKQICDNMLLSKSPSKKAVIQDLNTSCTNGEKNETSLHFDMTTSSIGVDKSSSHIEQQDYRESAKVHILKEANHEIDEQSKCNAMLLSTCKRITGCDQLTSSSVTGCDQLTSSSVTGCDQLTSSSVTGCDKLTSSSVTGCDQLTSSSVTGCDKWTSSSVTGCDQSERLNNREISIQTEGKGKTRESSVSVTSEIAVSIQSNTKTEFGNIFEKLSCGAVAQSPGFNTGGAVQHNIVGPPATVRGVSRSVLHPVNHVRFETARPGDKGLNEPQNLSSVLQWLDKGRYKSVKCFCEDVVRIIQLALHDPNEIKSTRKKALMSAKSVFVKQMEKVFPWFNLKTCKYWYINLNLPESMLPNATLPPYTDHTYAQWLAREATPLSPQPSPFKKRMATPVKRLGVLEEDESDILMVMDGEDSRRCMLCWMFGDKESDDAGRLLYCGQDDWVHVNCALWSAEVFEDSSGSLQNVMEAYSRGKMMRCDLCNRTGATVGCCTRGCPANYHFMCARLDYCSFQEDKKVFCKLHTGKLDGQLVEPEKFSVLRRVIVGLTNDRVLKKTWAKGLNSAEINIIIGSCTVEKLGYLTELSDRYNNLLPVDFMSTRIYWSTTDARRRSIYTCRILEIRPQAQTSPKVTIKDMRIIHDESHPDFVPLDQLDLTGIPLGVSTRMGNQGNQTVDLTTDKEDSRTLSDMSHTSSTEMTDTTREITPHDLPRSASFSGHPSGCVSVSEQKSLSLSWPSAKKKPATTNPPNLSVDLSLLSPKTLKWLNLKDPSKYASPVSKQTNVTTDDDFGVGLTRIADRLNRAAARNTRRGSEERTLPIAQSTTLPIAQSTTLPIAQSTTLPIAQSRTNSASSRSGSVERQYRTTAVSPRFNAVERTTRESSPAISMSLLKTQSEESTGPQSAQLVKHHRSILPHHTAASVAKETVYLTRPVDVDRQTDDREAAQRPQDDESNKMEIGDISLEHTAAATTSPVRDIPTPVHFSSPVLPVAVVELADNNMSGDNESMIVDTYTDTADVLSSSNQCEPCQDLPIDIDQLLSEYSTGLSDTVIVMTDCSSSMTDDEAIALATEALQKAETTEQPTTLTNTGDQVQSLCITQGEQYSTAEPSHTEANTEPSHTEANTEPSHTEANTEPRHTEANTEPRHTEANTEPRHTEANTEPRHTEANTEPTHTEATTEPTHTEATTESTHTEATTEPTHTEATTEPRHTEATTEPRHTEANTEPTHTEATTKPTHTEASTEPRHTEANTEPTHTEANTEPTHTEATTEPTHTEATTEPTHTEATTEPTHTEATTEPTHTEANPENILKGETTDPCHSETTDPCHSETTDPCQSETTDQCHSETTDPCQSETTDPCHSETTDPCQSETTDPCHSETTDQCQSETTDPCHSETTDQCQSETNKLRCKNNGGIEGLSRNSVPVDKLDSENFPTVSDSVMDSSVCDKGEGVIKQVLAGDTLSTTQSNSSPQSTEGQSCDTMVLSDDEDNMEVTSLQLKEYTTTGDVEHTTTGDVEDICRQIVQSQSSVGGEASEEMDVDDTQDRAENWEAVILGDSEEEVLLKEDIICWTPDKNKHVTTTTIECCTKVDRNVVPALDKTDGAASALCVESQSECHVDLCFESEDDEEVCHVDLDDSDVELLSDLSEQTPLTFRSETSTDPCHSEKSHKISTASTTGDHDLESNLGIQCKTEEKSRSFSNTTESGPLSRDVLNIASSLKGDDTKDEMVMTKDKSEEVLVRRTQTVDKPDTVMGKKDKINEQLDKVLVIEDEVDGESQTKTSVKTLGNATHSDTDVKFTKDSLHCTNKSVPSVTIATCGTTADELTVKPVSGQGEASEEIQCPPKVSHAFISLEMEGNRKRSPDKNIFDLFRNISPHSVTTSHRSEEQTESDIRSEAEKREVLHGLGLWSSVDAAQERQKKSNPVKTYPLRNQQVSPEMRRERSELHIQRRFLTFQVGKKQKSDKMEEEVEKSSMSVKPELPVANLLAQKIKLESLAKSTPGEKGPFKCMKCRRLYRTEASCMNHQTNCDFEVSTSEDEENDSSDKDEEDGLSVAMKPRSSLRQSTMVQRVAMETEEKQKAAMLSQRCVKRRSTSNVQVLETDLRTSEDLGKKRRGRSLKPQDTQTRKATSKDSSTNKNIEKTHETSLTKRGPGRPRKSDLYQSPIESSTQSGELSNRKERKSERCSKYEEEQTSEPYPHKRRPGRPRKDVNLSLTRVSSRADLHTRSSKTRLRHLLRSRLAASRSLPTSKLATVSRCHLKGHSATNTEPEQVAERSKSGREIKRKQHVGFYHEYPVSLSGNTSGNHDNLTNKQKSPRLSEINEASSADSRQSKKRRARSASHHSDLQHSARQHSHTQLSANQSETPGDNQTVASETEVQHVCADGDSLTPCKTPQRRQSVTKASVLECSPVQDVSSPQSLSDNSSPDRLVLDEKTGKMITKVKLALLEKQRHSGDQSAISIETEDEDCAGLGKNSCSEPLEDKQPATVIQIENSLSPHCTIDTAAETESIDNTLASHTETESIDNTLASHTETESIDNTLASHTETDIDSADAKETTQVGVPEMPSNIQVSKDPSNIQVSKDPSDIQVSKDPSNIQVSKDPSDVQVSKDSNDVQVSKDPSDIQVSKDPIDVQVSKDPSDIQVSKDTNDIQVSKDPSDIQVSKDPSDIQVSKDSNDIQVSKSSGTSPIDISDIQAHMSDKQSLSTAVLNLLRDGKKVVIRTTDNNQSVIWEKSGDKYLGRPYTIPSNSKSVPRDVNSTNIDNTCPSTVNRNSSQQMETDQQTSATEMVAQQPLNVSGGSRFVEEPRLQSRVDSRERKQPTQLSDTHILPQTSVFGESSEASTNFVVPDNDGSSTHRLPTSLLSLPPQILQVLKDLNKQQLPTSDPISLTYLGSINSGVRNQPAGPSTTYPLTPAINFQVITNTNAPHGAAPAMTLHPGMTSSTLSYQTPAHPMIHPQPDQPVQLSSLLSTSTQPVLPTNAFSNLIQNPFSSFVSIQMPGQQAEYSLIPNGNLPSTQRPLLPHSYTATNIPGSITPIITGTHLPCVGQSVPSVTLQPSFPQQQTNPLSINLLQPATSVSFVQSSVGCLGTSSNWTQPCMDNKIQTVTSTTPSTVSSVQQENMRVGISRLMTFMAKKSEMTTVKNSEVNSSNSLQGNVIPMKGMTMFPAKKVLEKYSPGRNTFSSKLSKILTKKALTSRPAVLQRRRDSPAIRKDSWSYEERNGVIQCQINSGANIHKVSLAGTSTDNVLPAKQPQRQQRKKMAAVDRKKKEKKGGQSRRKSPLKPRTISEPHSTGIISHPILHSQKNNYVLPQAEIEEEVRETPLNILLEQRRQTGHNNDMGNNIKGADGTQLKFEITSDDGFSCSSDSIDGAWKQVIEKVQDARAAARLKQLSYNGLNSVILYGLAHNSVRYLLEQLHGANQCRRYSFQYHRHEVPEEEEQQADNPSGCIRSEPFTERKPYDMFSFLMSRYRLLPMTMGKQGDEEMVHKSSRRATSMDLPMAMRFRKLQEHSREAVGVYRSHIHGRGLFCKRNIDGGEMIIEYAGEVIRSSLTDIREKYYESKGIGCYMFRIDDIDVVDATMRGSAARFINHSCEPNCYSKVISVEQRKHIVIFAIRPIKRGEELTYDYKFPIEEVKIPCSCGSKKCRKYLN